MNSVVVHMLIVVIHVHPMASIPITSLRDFCWFWKATPMSKESCKDLETTALPWTSLLVWTSDLFEKIRPKAEPYFCAHRSMSSCVGLTSNLLLEVFYSDTKPTRSKNEPHKETLQFEKTIQLKLK